MIHPKNPKEKNFSLVLSNGIGSIRCSDGLHDVEVLAYFTMWRWTFIIHRDIREPQYLTVSEASTGMQLIRENYYTIDDALWFAIPFIENKHYYFATAVNNNLVRFNCNLQKRNTTGLLNIMQWKL